MAFFAEVYPSKPVVLELKVRKRQGKCVGAVMERVAAIEKPPDDIPPKPTVIPIEVWVHLANYIKPENVQNYALICKESANSINCRLFWLNMFRRYCQHAEGDSKKWVLDLPEELQIHNLTCCDDNILREKVVRALYRCYPPFRIRLRDPYSVNTVKGRIYVSSWRQILNSKDLICYKFQFESSLICAKSNNAEQETSHLSDNLADDWESLADKSNNFYSKKKNSCITPRANSLLGICLLVIRTERFSPIPVMPHCDTGLLRFSDIRVKLSKKMKSYDLELKFISDFDGRIFTIKYLKMLECRAIPWWHPSFQEYFQCE